MARDAVVLARRSDKNAVDLVDHVHYSPTQIARVLGISATKIRQLMDEGSFPRSHGVTKNRGVWGSQVRAYLAAQVASAGFDVCASDCKSEVAS
jgi:predicted DNA-binding transcriptional regulator AlpA